MGSRGSYFLGIDRWFGTPRTPGANQDARSHYRVDDDVVEQQALAKLTSKR